MTTHTPNAIVMTAPDRCTKYLVHAVETSLDQMDPGAVLEVPCDSQGRGALAEWCLASGRTPLNLDEELRSFFIQNQAPLPFRAV